MFDTYKLNEEGFEDIKAFKEEMSKTITLVLYLMPDCAEKTIFIRKIEEAVFYGTRAISSKKGNFTEIVKY